MRCCLICVICGECQNTNHIRTQAKSLSWQKKMVPTIQRRRHSQTESPDTKALWFTHAYSCWQLLTRAVVVICHFFQADDSGCRQVSIWQTRRPIVLQTATPAEHSVTAMFIQAAISLSKHDNGLSKTPLHSTGPSPPLLHKNNVYQQWKQFQINLYVAQIPPYKSHLLLLHIS